MKSKRAFLLYCFIFICLYSCTEKEKVSSALKADFILNETNGEVVLLNNGSIGYNYYLNIDGERVKAGRLTDTLAVLQYGGNGSHYLSLCVYYNNGDEYAKHCKEVNFTIESLSPIIDWDLSYLGNGKVQILDSSKYINNTFYLGKLCGYLLKVGKADTLHFDRNGKYSISLGDGQLKTIEITDLPEIEPLQTFKGNFFGETDPPFANSVNQFYCSYGLLALAHSPVVTFESQGLGILLRNNRSFYPTESDFIRINDKYEYLKEVFKLGSINENIWTPLAYNKEVGLSSYVNIFEAEDSSIEIVEVEEVMSDRKMIPKMSDKAFWVTFKIYADLPEKGVINGYFKTKYVIY